MKNLLGENEDTKDIHVNIYADEIQSKVCPITRHKWMYIGLVIEDINRSLLQDIIYLRYCGNYDTSSKYFIKNDKVIHWTELSSADTKNICLSWINYILNPNESSNTFHSYILGINISKLNEDEFGNTNIFNNTYNRFFRSAVKYALKCMFSKRNVVVNNIYHEVGQQEHHYYFPWHTIHKINTEKERIRINTNRIEFLPKSHKEDILSNIIQLSDFVLGLSTSILHGVIDSNISKYRVKLCKKYCPLFAKIINNPRNINSHYRYANRIMISFFPRINTNSEDIERKANNFYHKRDLLLCDTESGQQTFAF